MLEEIVSQKGDVTIVYRLCILYNRHSVLSDTVES